MSLIWLACSVLLLTKQMFYFTHMNILQEAETAAFWKGYQTVKDHISLAQKLGKCCMMTIPQYFPGKAAKLIVQHVCFQYNYVCIFFWNTSSPWFGTELLVGPLLKFPIYLLICVPLTLSHKNGEHPHATGFCKNWLQCSGSKHKETLTPCCCMWCESKYFITFVSRKLCTETQEAPLVVNTALSWLQLLWHQE